MVGTGKTREDAIRPKNAPVQLTPKQLQAIGTKLRDRTEADKEAEHRSSITAFSYVLSDDKKLAISEFVAPHRDAFAEILKDKNIKSYEKKDAVRAKGELDAIQREFQKIRKDFDWSQLNVAGN